jgi:hypothetical protein
MGGLTYEKPRPAAGGGRAVLQRKCDTCGTSASCPKCAASNPLESERGASTDVRTGELAPSLVNEVLQSPGQSLDRQTLETMGRRFGHDFSGVRVHSDSRAAQSAREVSAAAYTVGRHVAFAEGNYAPNTAQGSRLLAHELAHVVQQGGRDHPGTGPIEIGGTSTSAEQEAERASSFNFGPAGPVAAGSIAPQMQRQAELGAVPCAPDAYRVHTRSVDVQPVSLRSSATDPSPTGASFGSWLSSANTIWNKLAVTFNALSTVTITDATNKTAGGTRAERDSIRALNSGSGVQVFMVNNPLTDVGGGATISAGAASKMVIANGATSSTLLAHELGHALGLGHPPGDADVNTIMEPSSSANVENPTRNTIGNYNRITYPAGGSDTCIRPDA